MPADEIFAAIAIGIMLFVVVVLVTIMYHAKRTHSRTRTVKVMKWYVSVSFCLAAGVIGVGEYGALYLNFKEIIVGQSLLLGSLLLTSLLTLLWSCERRI